MCKVPFIVLHLATRNLKPVNVSVLVLDEELAAEDVPLGLTLLNYILELTPNNVGKHRDILDGAECFENRPNVTDGGTERVDLLMIERMSQLCDDERTNVSSIGKRASDNGLSDDEKKGITDVTNR